MPNKPNDIAVGGKPQPVKDKTTGEQIKHPKKGYKWHLVIEFPEHWGTKKRPRKTITFYGTNNQAIKETRKLVNDFNREFEQKAISSKVVMGDAVKKTFGEYAAEWIIQAKHKMKRNTWEEYSRALKTHIIPAMGHIPLKDIHAQHISLYKTLKLTGGRLDGRKGGLNKGTINKHLSYISVVLDSATKPEHGFLLPFNPAKLVDRIKGEMSKKEDILDSHNAALVNCYNVHELNLLLAKLEKLYSFKRLPKEEKMKDETILALKGLGFTDKEIESPMALFKIKTSLLYPVVYLAARTGMRRSELLALKWSNIDFNKKVIKVYSTSHYGTKQEGEASGHFYNTTKEGFPKSYITITDKDVAFLRQLKKEQMKERRKFEQKKGEYKDLNLVFSQSNGLPLWGNSIGDALKDFIASNQLKQITLHGFRHTHCTLLLLAGVDVEYIAIRVGHRDSATTRRRYLHVARNNMPDLGDIIEKILETNAEASWVEMASAEQKAKKLLEAIGS